MHTTPFPQPMQHARHVPEARSQTFFERCSHRCSSCPLMAKVLGMCGGLLMLMAWGVIGVTLSPHAGRCSVWRAGAMDAVDLATAAGIQVRRSSRRLRGSGPLAAAPRPDANPSPAPAADLHHAGSAATLLLAAPPSLHAPLLRPKEVATRAGVVDSLGLQSGWSGTGAANSHRPNLKVQQPAVWPDHGVAWAGAASSMHAGAGAVNRMRAEAGS